MLSRKFGSVFDDDPFFEGHQRHMREMEKFFQDPFQAFREPLSLEDAPDRRRREDRDRGRRGDNARDLAPRSLFDIGGFDNMFHSMQDMMENMHKNFEKVGRDPDSHMLSHSSFASYSKMGGSEPKYFQASTSTQQAPGGIRETRKTLRDSESGQEKMAIGRYIGDRGRVIQRQRNKQSGKEDEDKQYVNMTEDDAGEFDREWQDRTRQMEQQIERGHKPSDRDRQRPQAVKF